MPTTDETGITNYLCSTTLSAYPASRWIRPTHLKVGRVTIWSPRRDISSYHGRYRRGISHHIGEILARVSPVPPQRNTGRFLFTRCFLLYLTVLDSFAHSRSFCLQRLFNQPFYFRFFVCRHSCRLFLSPITYKNKREMIKKQTNNISSWANF